MAFNEVKTFSKYINDDNTPYLITHSYRMLSTVNASQSRSTVGTSPWQRQGINHHWGLSRNQEETCSLFTTNRLPSYVESIMRVEKRTIGSFVGQPPYIARFSIHLPVGLTISHPSLHLSPCLLAFLLFYHGISSFLEDIFSDASSGHVTRKKRLQESFSLHAFRAEKRGDKNHG